MRITLHYGTCAEQGFILTRAMAYKNSYQFTSKMHVNTVVHHRRTICLPTRQIERRRFNLDMQMMHTIKSSFITRRIPYALWHATGIADAACDALLMLCDMIICSNFT